MVTRDSRGSHCGNQRLLLAERFQQYVSQVEKADAFTVLVIDQVGILLT